MLFDKIDEYNARFEDGFPFYQLRHLSEKEMIELIDKCLETNTPYTVKDDGLVY